MGCPVRSERAVHCGQRSLCSVFEKGCPSWSKSGVQCVPRVMSSVVLKDCPSPGHALPGIKNDVSIVLKPASERPRAACRLSIRTILDGRFSCQFKENFLKCSYTILHECEQLWSKIGHQESIIELLNQDHKKVICISFLDKNCGPSSPNNDLKSFFQDFHVQNLTTEQDVEIFVNTVVTTLQSVSNDEMDPGPEAIAPPRPHPIASKEYVFHKGYINASESVDVLFQRIMFLYSQVRERASSQQGAFMKYPDVIGYMYVPTVYLRLLPHDMDCSEIIDFSKIKNYTELKEFINLKEGDTFNISFFLNKIIPELYSSNCALGLATLALSQNNTLGEQSVSMLEQLIFRGHLGSASTNTDTLQSVQILLADPLVQLSQSLWSVSRKKSASCQNSKEMTMSRLANVIVLLQMEKLVTAFRGDNWQEFETSNDRLSTILNSCKQSENVKTLLRTLEMFFLRSPNKLNRTLQNLLTDISVDELILLAKEVWGKELGQTLLFVFSCFKKLFTTKNIRLVQVLKECVRTKSRISFWNSSLNPVVADIVYRGLTHFVTFCLREASHENIHEICVEVVKLIKSTSKLQPAHEVRKLKQALMFDPSPDIRREVIGLLEKKGLYDQHLDDFLIKELEKMLNPYLQLLDSAVTTTSDKIKVIGTFHQIPVLIQLQRPTILEHKGESYPASQGSQDRQLKSMIEILKQLDHDHILKLFAYRLTTIPKFHITEYYSNNLQDFLANKNKNHKYCNEKTLLLYLLQTSSALEHCHSKNIVHSNLTGASLFLVSKEKVMLGEFSLAVQLNSSKEILLRTEDTQSLPIRWTAPETLKERKVSLKSDVAMFGNLMYEVLTHGVLPYSCENLSDEEFFSRAVYFLIEPHRESCFKDDYYKLMLSCTHHRPERRPDIKNVQISLQHFLDNYSDDEVTSYSFPNLHDGTLKPSNQFTRGLPQTKKGYVIIILPKLEKVIQETIHYYKVGQFALFRETVSTHMSRMLVAKVHAGILDDIIPRVDIERVKNNNRTSHVIDIFLPANCTEDLCSLIDNNQVGQSSDSCLHLILKAAEMLKYFHDNNFILGQLKMSDIVIDMTSETLKIYPISLKHMIYKTSSTDSSSTTRQSPYDNIACSFETDIFIFGRFMKELLLKVDAMKRPTWYSEPNTVDSDSVNMEQLNMNSCPASMYTLMDKCMQKMPQDRPKLSEIIRDVNYEINKSESLSFIRSQSVPSGPKHQSGFNRFASSEMMVLNPSDSEELSEEEDTPDVQVMNQEKNYFASHGIDYHDNSIQEHGPGDTPSTHSSSNLAHIKTSDTEIVYCEIAPASRELISLDETLVKQVDCPDQKTSANVKVNKTSTVKKISAFKKIQNEHVKKKRSRIQNKKSFQPEVKNLHNMAVMKQYHSRPLPPIPDEERQDKGELSTDENVYLIPRKFDTERNKDFEIGHIAYMLGHVFSPTPKKDISSAVVPSTHTDYDAMAVENYFSYPYFDCPNLNSSSDSSLSFRDDFDIYDLVPCLSDDDETSKADEKFYDVSKDVAAPDEQTCLQTCLSDDLACSETLSENITVNSGNVGVSASFNKNALNFKDTIAQHRDILRQSWSDSGINHNHVSEDNVVYSVCVANSASDGDLCRKNCPDFCDILSHQHVIQNSSSVLSKTKLALATSTVEEVESVASEKYDHLSKAFPNDSNLNKCCMPLTEADSSDDHDTLSTIVYYV